MLIQFLPLSLVHNSNASHREFQVTYSGSGTATRTQHMRKMNSLQHMAVVHFSLVKAICHFDLFVLITKVHPLKKSHILSRKYEKKIKKCESISCGLSSHVKIMTVMRYSSGEISHI